MSDRVIAGHTFQDTPGGRSCYCGAKWADVLLARRNNIGELGWAHTGAMNESEYDSIETERDRVFGAVHS